MSISEVDRVRIQELRELVKNEFRKLWNLDTVADEKRDHPVHKYWKFGLTGKASPNSTQIVNIEQSGGNDYWGMLHAFPINQILRARVHDLECMLRAVMELEKEKGEQCHVMYIMDLEGLTMDRRLTTLLTGGLAAISAFMSEHYVEMVSSFVLVNVPSFITFLWSIAKPLLPERTRNKVNILGKNWKEDIQKLANPEALPSYWNNEGEDGVGLKLLKILSEFKTCSQILIEKRFPIKICIIQPFKADIERGQLVPKEEYYVDTALAKAKILQIPAGKDDHVDISVPEQNTQITWRIHSDGHFAFKLLKVNDNENSVSEENEQRIYPLFSVRNMFKNYKIDNLLIIFPFSEKEILIFYKISRFF
ncbi:hypothetical protein WR25_21781 isoform B [Diploscapter pachys]|uniref:CRAL-TRIO domain-containing protein n=1 Tax=Diploscapter pachys TaxID=2018661 RepID=A0A2A2LFG6_9BILA|nr:hypothetical protein WR25_21781 isoform B [Diploscapter pachys]